MSTFEEHPDRVPDSAALLERLRDMLDTARKLPMSASVSINRDEFGMILDDAIVASVVALGATLGLEVIADLSCHP